MTDSNGDKRNHSKLVSVCEAIVLLSATVMVILLYLYFIGEVSLTSPIIFGILVVMGIVASIVTTYRKMRSSRQLDESTEFRINAQLNETLKAVSVPPDITFGFDKLINANGETAELIFEGETELLTLMEAKFGKERTEEVKSVILRYARMNPIQEEAGAPVVP